MSASVKVMLSFDYCHFEVAKSSDQDLSNEQIDAMRKDCMRLADKAIAQYKIARDVLNKNFNLEIEKENLEKIPESERTPQQLAVLKKLKDERYWASRPYDYEDDFDGLDNEEEE